MSEYRVGVVARLSGVSIRTLHHYDEIGLLHPSGRSDAGYRQYSADDVARLRQILFYRELDFPLEQIAAILADPDAGAEEHLRHQHRLLRERKLRAERLLNAIETEMEARRMGLSLTPEEQLELFGTDELDGYLKEAEQRWGESGAYKESQRRTATYTKDDWVTIKREADENITAFARALRSGKPPDGEAAMQLAEAHRQHISRWFYECPLERHLALAALYVSDSRYTKHYDELAPGLADYVHDSIQANATAHR
jgi:DNA-binding transcriptional MerR regulator